MYKHVLSFSCVHSRIYNTLHPLFVSIGIVGHLVVIVAMGFPTGHWCLDVGSGTIFVFYLYLYLHFHFILTKCSFVCECMCSWRLELLVGPRKMYQNNNVSYAVQLSKWM